jgi:hypothetical protein
VAQAVDRTPASGSVASRIEEILARRLEQLPGVRADIEWWGETDRRVGELGHAVDELRRHPSTPADLAEALAGFRVEELREAMAEAVAALRVLETRFSRETINIGVSGQARVGKSTLLQSVSALDDQQIPTGEGLPVTAVRSRVYHSAELRRATLRMHSFASFRDEVLAPYHEELGLPGLPAGPEEFRAWTYPEPSDEVDSSERRAMLIRLREMHESFPSYAGELTGRDQVVELDRLRPLVAYPTNDEINAPGVTPRRYLAVREARIECPFHRAQVRRLGIVDLPGLGELTVRAEAHHVAGLRHEVDVVLLVKRPVEGMAYWGKADGRALTLIGEARSYVSDRDFAFIVLNTGGAAGSMVRMQRDDVLRQVNDGVPGRFHQVLEADAADPDEVAERVISPVLAHLAGRLPEMDASMLRGTRAELRALAARAGGLLDDLAAALSSVPRGSGSSAEDLDRRAVRLRQDLAGPLIERVGALRELARGTTEDPDFVAAVEATYGRVKEWVAGGLGVGEQAWLAEGLRTMRVDRNSSGWAGDELNRVRVQVSNLFEGVDGFFAARVQALFEDIAGLLTAHLGTLLDGYSGEAAIRRFAELLAGASEPCPSLGNAVRQLLNIRLDYRSQLHPRVRAELDGLSLQVHDRRTGQLRTQIVVEVSEAGVAQLYRFVLQLAEQAAYLTRKALLQQSVTPSLVLHAAAEQFEDSLIRSGDSEHEFKRLARSYRDEIWPGVFGELDAANARVAAVLRGRAELAARLREVPGGTA